MQHIGVLGTGTVGNAIATRLVSKGYSVMMGSRTADNPKAGVWARTNGARSSAGTYAEAAGFGELLFNCTRGDASLEALESAGEGNLAGKVLVDVANPLDLSRGMPPTLFISGADSLGERIQRRFPSARVVKSLNTVNASVMVDPSRVPGQHDIFVSGNDAEAKGSVSTLLREAFGWSSVIDLGDITTARGPEAYLMLWLRLWGVAGTADFNIQVRRAR